MIIVKLKWMEPDTGSCRMRFPDSAESDLNEVQKWVKEHVSPDDYGCTIASITITKKDGVVKENEEKWEELSDNLRYSTGEDLYTEDCPALSRHGVSR